MKKNKKHQKRTLTNRANKKVLSQDALSLLLENAELTRESVKLKAEALSWKTAWFDQRDISGKAAWAMPPEGYGRSSTEVSTMEIFDFKLEQPCSAEETKTRIAKAKEVRKEYMAPIAEKKPRMFGSGTNLKFAESCAIDLFDNEVKPIIKYDAWQSYLNMLRQK